MNVTINNNKHRTKIKTPTNLQHPSIGELEGVQETVGLVLEVIGKTPVGPEKRKIRSVQQSFV